MPKRRQLERWEGEDVSAPYGSEALSCSLSISSPETVPGSNMDATNAFENINAIPTHPTLPLISTSTRSNREARLNYAPACEDRYIGA